MWKSSGPRSACIIALRYEGGGWMTPNRTEQNRKRTVVTYA